MLPHNSFRTRRKLTFQEKVQEDDSSTRSMDLGAVTENRAMKNLRWIYVESGVKFNLSTVKKLKFLRRNEQAMNRKGSTSESRFQSFFSSFKNMFNSSAVPHWKCEKVIFSLI